MKCLLLLVQKFTFKMIEGKFSYWIRRDGIQWNNWYKNYANRKEVSDLFYSYRDDEHEIIKRYCYHSTLVTPFSTGAFRFQYLFSNDRCLQSLSTKTWVRLHTSRCGIYVGRRGTGIRVSPSTSVFPVSIIPPVLTFTSYANNANTTEREVNEIFLPI
jgi:hypothetical protein